MPKILFLDLDGTIREPKSGAKFINDPLDQQLIEGAAEAIAHYHSHGWQLIGITNQGGVAAGHKSMEDARIEQRITLELAPNLQGIYFCPDYEGLQCGYIGQDGTEMHLSKPSTQQYGSFRKPGPGMIQLALKEFPPAEEIWMVGDRTEDKLAAKAAGVNFVWADIWRHRFMKGIGELDLSERDINLDTLRKFLAT